MANRKAHPQDDLLARSLSDPEGFWTQQAAHLHWHRPPSVSLRRTTKTLAGSAITHPHWEWFPDGELSTGFNCVDRHVLLGRGENAAILYDSPVSDSKQRITYAQLLDEVSTLAGVLREEGVERGDVVLLYMPMVPAAIFGLLATNRIGALHAVVFGGFAPVALAQRIEACRPKVVLTASCGLEGATKVVAYREPVEEAISLSKWKPARTIIWQRESLAWHPVRGEDGQRSWHTLVESARRRGVKLGECVAVGATDGVYVIYTSGTTGAPKGVVRDAGGHAVGLHLSMRYMFGVQGPGHVVACFSDIGWVVGHSYLIYGPLLVGATTVLYEGKPVGTPDAGAFWRIVDEYRVNVMFTAPTALRAIRRLDPESKHLRAVGEHGGLRSLRGLFLAGERSEPALIELYQALLAKYGAREGAHVVDNWWSSESGSPISGVAMAPLAGMADGGHAGTEAAPLAIKPGSAGKPMPGFDVRIVDDDGKELPRGQMGNVVLAPPLAPTAFRTLWDDEERFYRGYLRRFGGCWLDTGDAGVIDQDGYISIMARADDIINVAAHRLSTGAIEQALTCHPLVTEACIVGLPDSLKGHLPFAFVVTTAFVPEKRLLSELNALVRRHVGPIATLGGVISASKDAPSMIPKTRSGKTLRRVLREIVETRGMGEVIVPSSVEDAAVAEEAKSRVRRYFGARL